MTDCLSIPITVSESDFVIIPGTTYTAEPVLYVFNQETGMTTVSATFTGLPLTILQPNEAVDIVRVSNPF